MDTTGERWRLGHRPALDGLRGVAVLLVVVAHTFPGYLDAAGSAGVTIFFTLSGFLITSLLLEERHQGRIALGAFYQRRARRLFPALAVFLVTMLVLGLTVSPVFATPRSVASVALYLGNYSSAFGDGSAGIGHTWSLAVEEQFYIAYPLVVIGLTWRALSRWLLWAAGAGVLCSFTLRLCLWDGGAGSYRTYYGTDTNAGALLIGCVVAIIIQGGTVRRTWPRTATALLAFVALLAPSGEGLASRLLVPLAVPLLAAAVIVLIARGPYSGWLASRWAVLVGRRSYGLYLWHYPVLTVILPSLTVTRWVGVPAMLAVCWGLTWLSWRYVEQPFLGVKENRGQVTRLPPMSLWSVNTATRCGIPVRR